MKLSRGDFGQRGKKKSELNCSPKKRFDPTINFDCSLSVQDVSAALKQVCDDSLVFTTEMKQPTEVSMEDSEKFCTLDDFLLVSTTADEFFLHMEYFPSHVKDIEFQTRVQSSNPFVVCCKEAHDNSFKSSCCEDKASKY